jgi:hypothetical protein
MSLRWEDSWSWWRRLATSGSSSPASATIHRVQRQPASHRIGWAALRPAGELEPARSVILGGRAARDSRRCDRPVVCRKSAGVNARHLRGLSSAIARSSRAPATLPWRRDGHRGYAVLDRVDRRQDALPRRARPVSEATASFINVPTGEASPGQPDLAALITPGGRVSNPNKITAHGAGQFVVDNERVVRGSSRSRPGFGQSRSSRRGR